MSIVGFQSFWQVGCRVVFQKKAVNDVAQRVVDFGLIKSVAPSLNPNIVKLFDPDGGQNRLVDQGTTQIEEAYDIVCANFNQFNLSYLYLSEDPEEFVQDAEGKDVEHTAWEDGFVKIHDDDPDETWLYALSKVIGVYGGGTTTLTTLTTITPSTRTFSFSADPGLTVGEFFIVKTDGGVSVANAGTYEVESISGSGPYLVVSVETPAGATQSGLTGTAVVTTTTPTSGGVFEEDVDYSVVSLDRGYINLINACAQAYNGTDVWATNGHTQIHIVFATDDFLGIRLLRPQSIKGQIEGRMALFMGREANRKQHVRECRVAMAPTAQSLTLDDFSNFTMRVTVLSDIGDEDAGRLIAFVGDLPPNS